MYAPSSPRLVLATYTAAVFLSALLLFAVQPMFTRMVLPQLGGSPSVWSIAMVFFQTMLLAGYAYAHWLAKTPRRMATATHLALLIAAALTLPLSIAQGWGEPPAQGTAFWLLGLFTISIGLPFFALAANNPLLQTLFVNTGHRDGKDPYFLYAASNIGSFLALLSYPVLIEPTFALQFQSRLWSGGFVALMVLIAACAALMLRAPPDAALAHQSDTDTPKPDWRTIARWVFVSAVPSGLLVAVTAHISTDVAAAPLIWVMPLSLYLLTWVLVFARKPPFSQSLMLLMQPFAIAGVVVLILNSGHGRLLINLAAHLLAFFVIAMACNGELAHTRPRPAHLTAFYVSLSFGGMVGGLFAGLLSPFIFNSVAEYPILAVLAALCRPPGALWRPIERWFWSAAGLATVVLIVPSLLGFRATEAMATPLHAVVFVLAALSVAVFRAPGKSAVVVALAFAVIRLYPLDNGRSELVRSFFGVNRIYESSDRHFRVLEHGSTIHGAQRILTADGKVPTGRPVPATYYHPKSPMAVVIGAVRARKAAPIRVAIIGLGAGSLSCYIEPGENWRFFEIDPTIVAIARDPKRFTFISSCAPDVPIVLGDARLTLAKEPDGAYDLIVVDAYSSDAIPVHLATREAMAIYKAKLAPHGVVLMHISNRHLELQSVVVGISATNDLKTWVWDNAADDDTDFDNYIYTSEVAISAAEPADIGALNGAPTWLPIAPDPALRTWTDDYSNIVGAFWRRLRQ